MRYGLFNIDPEATTREQIARNRAIMEKFMKPGQVRYAGEGAMKGLAAAIGGFGVGRANKAYEAGRSNFIDNWFRTFDGPVDGGVTHSTRGEPAGGYVGGSGGGYSSPPPSEPLNQGFGFGDDMMMGEELSFNQPAPEGGFGASDFMMPEQYDPLPLLGNVRGVDQGLLDKTAQAWGYVLPGGQIDVSTGVSSHSPVNHAPGHAIDYRVTRPDGTVVGANDPEMVQAAQIGRAMGIHGIGFGPGYMGGTHTHWDVSRNGPRTWGDDDGTASDALGAGSPEIAQRIAAATGRPVEDVLAELGINMGDPQQLAFGPTAQRDQMNPQMAALMQGGAPMDVTASARGPITVDAPPEFAAMADAEAQRAGIDPNLFRGVITQESAWNPNAVSPVGAAGLTQVMPATGRDPGFGVAPLRNPNDPQEQLRFGADYLSAMLRRYDGDVTRALVAYNAGPGVADNWDGRMASLPRETQGYVANITGMTGGFETTASARDPGTTQSTASTQGREPDRRVAQAGGGISDASLDLLYQQMMNPFATDAERAVIGSIIDQRMQASDPMRQLQMQQLQLQIEQMRNPAADPTALMQNVEWLVSQGVPFEDALAQVRGGTTIYNNMGGEQGEWLYGADGGVPAGWRVNTITGEASRIPGGPADVEAQEAADMAERRETQDQLRMGPTLESLNLNIAEIEDGGMPVTGAFGDFRRTNLGRFLTGSDAVDFGNRTDQITDSAAFAEIQRMRDNSPTGGAVGQLTDDERRAIGNSITALNNSTSAEEYLRAARAYRQLALDTAYGEGMWELRPDGSVIARSQDGRTQSGRVEEQRAPEATQSRPVQGSMPALADVPNLSREQMINLLTTMDFSTLTPEMRAALEARGQELGL